VKSYVNEVALNGDDTIVSQRTYLRIYTAETALMRKIDSQEQQMASSCALEGLFLYRE
jgi:hypothetical protein